MKARNIKKYMLKRFAKKLSTFKLEFDPREETIDVYVLDRMWIGSICCDEVQRVRTVGYETKRVDEKDIVFEMCDRFTDSARDLIFDILLGISVWINQDGIDPKQTKSYLYNPEAFFNMNYHKDDVISSTH